MAFLQYYTFNFKFRVPPGFELSRPWRARGRSKTGGAHGNSVPLAPRTAELLRTCSRDRSSPLWEEAAVAILEDYWGKPLDPEGLELPLCKALAILGRAAFLKQPTFTEQYVLEGWARGVPDKHPPHLHRGVRLAALDLGHLFNLDPVPLKPHGRALLALLTEFALLEGVVRPHLGLMWGIGRIAAGETPTVQDIMTQAGKIRSLESMREGLQASFSKLRAIPETASAVEPIAELMGQIASKDKLKGDYLPLEDVRNIVGHLDLDIFEDGHTSYGFNRFNRLGRAYQSTMPLAEVESALFGVNGLSTVLAAWSDFLSVMAAGVPDDPTPAPE